MDRLRIIGGTPLGGSVRVSGAKNAALPCMAAALLTPETVTLRNLPYVRDCITLRRLLEDLGATVCVPELRTHEITAAQVETLEAPYELVKTMRASVLVLGPLLTRFGEAKVSLPGGCAIGTRPVDLHIEALRLLGAEVAIESGSIVARVERRGERLRGAEVTFDKVTVTGTENLMMAATLARGRTTLRNSACEPEVVDLADLLNRMGARISGAGTPAVTIEGVEALGAAEHTIIPDRIEAGTFLVAAAITRGELELLDCRPAHLTSVIALLRETGVEIEAQDESTLHVSFSKKVNDKSLKARDCVTAPYPGFPTDMQAQYMALMTQAAGRSSITEAIFENRFMHAAEMRRMNATIHVEGRTAIVQGPANLAGARIQASDLRASASLVLAALVAEGETIIDRVYHIDRGYEKIEAKLRAVGADIERLRD